MISIHASVAPSGLALISLALLGFASVSEAESSTAPDTAAIASAATGEATGGDASARVPAAAVPLATAGGGSPVAARRGVYAGFGLGRSWTEPDASDVAGFEPNDRVHLGAQLTVGTDLSRHFAVEAHAAELGEAGFSPSGSIGYRQLGASAIGYVGRRADVGRRQGLMGFGRLGVGTLLNEASAGIDYERENGAHLLAGLGLEYALRNGLAARAETVVFDADVNYTQLALLYRFGRGGERAITPMTEPVAVAAPEPAPVVEPVAEPIAAAALPIGPDGDLDLVIDPNDDCPDTLPGIAVDTRGCDLFSGSLDGVTFASGSAVLTAQAAARLDGVVETLAEHPDVTFELTSHTDSRGRREANQRLSEERADAVALYLVAKGIARDRFETGAFGETRPIASNESAAGRERNRRVELVARR